MSAWGDTWPDGSEITPVPGMLIHDKQDGDTWLVLDAESATLCHAHGLRVTTPLAPAPTPGGLWDALELLPWEYPAMGTTHLHLDHGRIYRFSKRDGKRYIEYQAASINCECEHAKAMRDMQKFGALLAYCEQPGWEAK